MNTNNNISRTQRNLKIIICNINGLGGKHKYLQILLNEADPDLVFISETKSKRPIIPHLDIGSDNYDIVQLRSTTHGRGGLVVLTKHGLQLELAKVIMKEQGHNFIHAIFMEDK